MRPHVVALVELAAAVRAAGARSGRGAAVAAVRDVLRRPLPSGRTPRSVVATVRARTVRRLLELLSDEALTALVASSSREELLAWHRLLDDARQPEADAGLVAVGSRVALPQWRRFGAYTEAVDPAPGGQLVDDARGGQPVDVADVVHGWAQLEGPLAVTGPGDAHAYAPDDVLQGSLGNCFLIAALQAIAERAPDLLARLCTPNANGTWTVTFPDGRRTVVGPDVLVDVHGDPVFARRPHHGEVELWPMLLEKAYAQRHGGWTHLDGGHAADAVHELTGAPSHVLHAHEVDLDLLGRWHAAGGAVIVGTVAPPAGVDRATWLEHEAPAPFREDPRRRLYPGHAFVVTDVDTDARTVSLRNPWDGAGDVPPLAERELHDCIASVHLADLAAVRRAVR